LIAKKILIVDCQASGISGDKIVAALIDLGANKTRVVKAMESAKSCLRNCESLKVIVSDVHRRGIMGKRIEVRAKEKFKHRSGVELREAVKNCVKKIKLSKEAKAFALKSVNTLLKAEMKVHGEEIGHLHLHELGSVDTIADIVGVTVALNDLGLFKGAEIYSMPVAVGGGLIKFSHGVTSSPAPVTLEILKSKHFPIIGGPVKAELTTPTGAAILVSMVNATTHFHPLMKPVVTGYGAGYRDFKEFPNILRATLGEEVLAKTKRKMKR